MSNSPFSHLPEDASDIDVDLTSDPPVDSELRDFIQRFSVGPTPEEQARFWDDLSQKLPEPKASAHVFAPPVLKRYLPWTALASGMAVVLLFLAQPGDQSVQQAEVSHRVEYQEAPASEALNDVASEAEPMVLGAAPAARQAPEQRLEKAKQAERSREGTSPAPLGLRTPDFPVRWEPLSEKVFLVHILANDRERLLKLAADWPSGLVLTEVLESSVPDTSAEPHEKREIYRLEDRR